MQTFLSEAFRETSVGREADEIIRACVHCGFCNATCPTYQLLGDERDGPRGRIYLIKEMLENNTASRATQVHLDRCLTCRSCETTCPSGVQYNRLLEIGRAFAESNVDRPLAERIQRQALMRTVPEPHRFGQLLRLANLVRPLLPAAQKKSIPVLDSGNEAWPSSIHARKVLLLEGCAQSVTAPRINLAAARVMDRLGVQALPAAGCCGALSHHLSDEERTRASIRKNIERWWPAIEAGAEALILTATGCAPTVLTQDLGPLDVKPEDQPLIAFHSPCTLQHGLKSSGKVEALLTQMGFRLANVSDSHLCCGSAGSYSILQKDLSRQLLERKLACLEQGKPTLIATANIGCLMHLQSGTDLPVKHWIELLA